MLDTIQWIADRSASSALNGRARCTDNRAQLIKFISGIGHTRTPCAGGTCLVRPEASKHLSCRIRKSCKTNSLQFKKQKWRNIDLILRVSYSGSTPCKWLRLRFETRWVFSESPTKLMVYHQSWWWELFVSAFRELISPKRSHQNSHWNFHFNFHWKPQRTFKKQHPLVSWWALTDSDHRKQGESPNVYSTLLVV